MFSAYELDPASKCYALLGIFHDTMKISVPFPVQSDLVEKDQRG